MNTGKVRNIFLNGFISPWYLLFCSFCFLKLFLDQSKQIKQRGKKKHKYNTFMFLLFFVLVFLIFFAFCKKKSVIFVFLYIFFVFSSFFSKKSRPEQKTKKVDPLRCIDITIMTISGQSRKLFSLWCHVWNGGIFYVDD